MAEKPVHEQVQDLLTKWNKPPEDVALSRLVGTPTDPGDTRATAHVRDATLDHDKNPGSDKIDAGRMYADDGDTGGDSGLPPVPTDDDGNPDYDEMKNADLKEHLAARDLPVSGNHAELVSRLQEDDESDDDDEDEED